ncbi:MAG: alpha/beta fold hydrolase [Phycisphaerales bacterium JB063]
MRELTLPGRMILLPGFGCDGRIFAPQRRAFGDRLETPDPIAPVAGESIAHYAERWAKQLGRPGDDTPMVIGGLSLGGVIALEVAKHIEPKPRAVLLIASTRRADRWSFAVQLAQMLGRLVPASSANSAASLLALAYAMRDGLDDDAKKLMRAMAKDIDPALVKWAGQAAIDWPGVAGHVGELPPIHHIHGQNDWVIHAADEADEVLELGRHTINLSHASSVNRFLFDHFLKYVPEAKDDYPSIENPRLTAQRRLILEGAPAGTPLV